MNPSGLCLCGCGGNTTVPTRNNAHFGYVKGQPVDYIKGHYSKKHRNPKFSAANAAYIQAALSRGRRTMLYLRGVAAVSDKIEETMQALRRRTQKQGPYKAGRTAQAKVAADKIEAAMKKGRA